MRKKKPHIAALDEVQIARDGDTAIITFNDPDVAITHLTLGADLTDMTDQEVLQQFNATIIAQEQMAAAHPHVAIEVPPGRQQIEYFEQGDQWVPRGNVLRCIIESAEEGEAVIHIDDRELTLDQFGRLLTTYAGWGMRIEFVPNDELNERPELEVREPER